MSKLSNKNTSHLVPIVLLINKNDLKQEKTFKISDVTNKVKNLSFNIWTSYYSCKDNNYKEITDKIDSILKENSDNAIRTLERLQINSTKTNDLYTNSYNRNSFKIRKSSSADDRENRSQKSCCN